MDASIFATELTEFLAKGEIHIAPVTKPSWLLSDFREPIWLIKTSQSRKVNGQWVGVLKVRWGRPIAGRSKRLTDPDYSLLLEHLKLLCIAASESPATYGGIEHAFYNCSVWLLLADWLLLHREEQVKAFGLNALDCDAIEKFLFDLRLFGAGAGDWIAILEDYLLRQFNDPTERDKVTEWESHQSAELLDLIDHPSIASVPFQLPQWLRWTKRWLHMKGWIKSDGRVKIEAIASILSLDLHRVTHSPSLLYYLRQFEDTVNYCPFEGVRFREKMGHKHRTIEEQARAPITESTLSSYFVSFCTLARCAPYCVGLAQNFTLTETILQSGIPAFLKGSDTGRTPSMPVEIALHIYKHAIHWALHYSKPLMTYYVQLARWILAHGGTLSKLPKSHQKIARINWWQDAFNALPVPKALEALNIAQFYGMDEEKGTHDRTIYRADGSHPLPAILRKTMGLEDAINLNNAVIVLLAAAFTARRESELHRLLRDCISYIPGRGAFIDFGLAKATTEGIRLEQQRPIPTMLFDLLNAQAKFADALTATYQVNDVHLEQRLFVFPIQTSQGSGLSALSSAINTYIDLFCDYIEVPVNEKGRRWYIRTHEARRFFALAFFWLFEGSNLATLTWFMGHSNIQETWRYIKSEMTGAEISQAEAMIAVKAMKTADYTGADALREIVFRHFEIANLELIKPEELEDYLVDLREKGVFSIQAHAIGTDDGSEYPLIIEVYKEDAV